MEFRPLMYRPSLLSVLLLSLLTLTAAPLRAVNPKVQLAPVYRHWLDEEVTYIISTPERKEFLALHRDVERDNFITAFWEARNPNPGAPYNSYKEEHYRRLAYASEQFGSRRYQDGWRTDMGRVYITLGAPKQKQTYHLTANIRDLEIWFFQSETPALPAYFNILFFRPGAGEDYKMYSPRNDGPYRLVTTGQQDNKSAMHVIRQQLGPELAHAALSLIPSEPVDFDSLQPSMDSDLMLTTIRNLPDSPIEKQRITAARAREKAVSSVIVQGGPSDLETTVYRDSRGRLTLSYLLRNHAPIPSLIGKRKDGATGYSLNLRSTLLTSTGQPIYEQQSPLEGSLSEPQATAARSRNFGAEDRLPIVPGTYQLEIALRNNLTAETTLFREHLVVPDLPATQFSISPLEVYGRPSPVADPSGALPFTISGLRFAPHSIQTATIHVGDRLPIVFQLHLPPATAAAPRPAAIHIHYLFGTVSTGGGTAPPTEADEDVDTSSADAAGNILTGRTLDTHDLAPGSFRVVVHAIGAPGTTSASSSLQLRVVTPDTPVDMWTAYGPEPPQADDLKRGLAAQAAGRWDESADWYAASVASLPEDPRSLRQFALALAHLKRTTQLAALAAQPQLSKAAEPEVVLLITTAIDSSGSTQRAATFLASQIALQPSNSSLLNAAAGLYDRLGDSTRARDYRERARSLAP